MAVRWYFSYRLSAANVRDLPAEPGMDVSRQTVCEWVQKFNKLLPGVRRRHAKRIRSRWYVDETYVRVGKTVAYLYRAVDEAEQAVDVLLREKSDVESAKAFFEQAIKRRGAVPKDFIINKHRAYVQAVRRHAPKVKHHRTGLHRKRAPTTKPIEHSHVPIKDRLRSIRGLGSVETGQCLLEGVELAHAVQPGDIRPPKHESCSVDESLRLEGLILGLRKAA
jgi:transposase-like protein